LCDHQRDITASQAGKMKDFPISQRKPLKVFFVLQGCFLVHLLSLI